jgi:oligopeptidase B
VRGRDLLYVACVHGFPRHDEFAWMHDDPAALAEFLREERARYDAVTAHSRPLRDTLFGEMSQRVPSADRSVSWRHGNWLYYTETPSGKEYARFCRRSVTDSAAEAVLLDGNRLAAPTGYLGVGVRELSPDDRFLAYSVDTVGDEVFELRVRDLTAGEDLEDVVPRSYYGCAWSADSAQLLYVVHDDAYRPFRVMRHVLGRPTAEDAVVFEEPDERFEVEVSATRSGELAVISVTSRDTSECWLVPTAELSAPPVVVEPRRRGVNYSVDHVRGDGDSGWLAIVTNDGAPEFRLARAPVATPGVDHWEPLLDEDPASRLHAADAFAGRLVLSARCDGLSLLRVMDLASGDVRDELPGVAVGAIRLSSHDDELEPVHDPYDSPAVTVTVESLVEPPAWWRLDLATGDRSLLRRQEVPGYSPGDYAVSRLLIAARDGTEVPVSVVRRDGVGTAGEPAGGPAPCLLYGYGAYEASLDPEFDVMLPSLLDRGVLFAVAHVRGGGERGRWWWEQGRLREKRTTFTDYLDVADGLVQRGLVDGSRLATRGLSAGGLLQGAVFSMAPERWRTVVAEVPFVDVVTTMLDASVPLTATEWDEWGDPRDPADYAYMASYSPYDNVPPPGRPDLLVTGALHDPRVMVREPAKWVARLRATGGPDDVVLFRAETGSGAHVGPSGRYDRLRYEAEIYAFVLESLSP